MKYSRPLLFAALALLAVVTPVRADPIAWSYSWSPTSSTLNADSPGTGSISLSGEPLRNAFGNGYIVATNILTNSVASPGTPDNLTLGGGYQLNLTLKDTLSGISGTLSFKGSLFGSFSSGSANIFNNFLSPSSQSTTLGGNTFSVTLTSYLPPGPAAGSGIGAIGAYVTVTAGIPGGTPHPSSISPEPSSLLLCSLGTAGCVLAGWRRRRTRLSMISPR